MSENRALNFLRTKIPLWGWLAFAIVDWLLKFLVLRVVGYSGGVALISSTLSTPGALIVGVLAYAPFKRVGAQGHHHRHLMAGQRQRYQRLAIGVLAQRRSVLRRHPDRM